MRNLQLIRTICFVGIALFVALFVGTYLFFPTNTISLLYGLVVPVLVAYLVYTQHALSAKFLNARQALRATLLLYVFIMAYVILMSVFPHPDAPSVYFPLFLLMAPVMFILPAYQHVLMSVFSFGVFAVLVTTFKAPNVWSHELFEAFMATVFSLVVITLMTQFQIQTDTLKNKYFQMSQLDALTGVLNKASGEAALAQYLRERRRTERCALLFVDIDRFKTLNDSYGHLEGDRILRDVGNVLLELCRKNDIVCRFGGDEFLVALKDVEKTEAVLAKAQRINKAINAINSPTNQPLTCSIGICLNNGESLSSDELINRADDALYQAKASGKDSYVVFIQPSDIESSTAPASQRNIA